MKYCNTNKENLQKYYSIYPLLLTSSYVYYICREPEKSQLGKNTRVLCWSIFLLVYGQLQISRFFLYTGSKLHCQKSLSLSCFISGMMAQKIPLSLLVSTFSTTYYGTFQVGKELFFTVIHTCSNLHYVYQYFAEHCNKYIMLEPRHYVPILCFYQILRCETIHINTY